PAARGECASCHEPHQSAAAGLLKQKPAELCGTCHAELAKRIREGTPHAPVAMGMCLTCHASHGSANAGMTRRDGAALCANCHAPTNAKLVAKHPGMDMAGGRCVSCHDPHVQRKGSRGLIRPWPHLPFARGDCLQCHTSRGKPATIAKGEELCLRCHEQGKTWLARATVHPPLKGERQCLTCHEPHAGAAQHVLKRGGDALCLTCHEAKRFQGRVVHMALSQGCTTCHDPHASDGPKLVEKDIPTLCQTCHTDMSKHFHPVAGRPDPRTGGPLVCTSCHRPHASEEDALLTHEPKRELCLQCHDPTMAPKAKKR
ncbi:MAG: cytochrome c3 family protein, partial [Candidatus Eisenbacteria bacterium]